MATKTKAVGFSVRCPLCGDDSPSLSLALVKLEEVSCSSCSESFTVYQARDMAAAKLAEWEAIIRLIETAETMATP